MPALSLSTPEGRLAFSKACALEAALDCRPDAIASPSAAILKDIRDLVPTCRIGNGGGGACHVVSEVLEDAFGWRRVSGTYLCPDGHVICADGHYWNALPDGSWIDGTADQFGETTGVRVIPVGHPDHARYRYGFNEDWGPATEDFAERFPAFADPNWSVTDDEDGERADKAFGPDWHVRGDQALLDAYRWRDAVHTVVGDWMDPHIKQGAAKALPRALWVETASEGLIRAATDGLARVAAQQEALSAVPWGDPGNRVGDPALARLVTLVDEAAAALKTLDRAVRERRLAGPATASRGAINLIGHADAMVVTALGLRARTHPYGPARGKARQPCLQS